MSLSSGHQEHMSEKTVTLYNSKGAPDVEEVVQAQGIISLTKMIIAF